LDFGFVILDSSRSHGLLGHEESRTLPARFTRKNSSSAEGTASQGAGTRGSPAGRTAFEPAWLERFAVLKIQPFAESKIQNPKSKIQFIRPR
jgi:hypothetical protein